MINSEIDWLLVNEKRKQIMSQTATAPYDSIEDIFARIILIAEYIGLHTYGIGGCKDIIIELQTLLLDFSSEMRAELIMFEDLEKAYGKKGAEERFAAFSESITEKNKENNVFKRF